MTNSSPQTTLVSWSTGKDSAFACAQLLRAAEYKVAGLFCSVNAKFARTAMHAVRLELLRAQAERAGLPLSIVEIPYPCPNAQYEKKLGDFVAQSQRDGFVFADVTPKN